MGTRGLWMGDTIKMELELKFIKIKLLKLEKELSNYLEKTKELIESLEKIENEK